MNEILKHLENKNYWFRKYLACNESYAAALEHAPELAVDELEFFYGNRESLLKIIEGIDKKIQAQLQAEGTVNNVANSEQRTKINFHIREKESIMRRILELDQIILGRLETMRKDFVEKMQAMNKGKKALAKYKSANKHNEKLDKQV